MKFIHSLVATSFIIGISIYFLVTPVQASISDAIGVIEPPPGVEQQNAEFTAGQTDPDQNIAIFFFLNKFIQVLNVLAGIWVIVNLTLAAFDYISSQGKAEAHQKVRDKLTMSVAGLALLVVAYMAIAILSALFFGDPGYILNPKL